MPRRGVVVESRNFNRNRQTAVTASEIEMKSGSKVTQGHRNRHISIRHLWRPVNVL